MMAATTGSIPKAQDLAHAIRFEGLSHRLAVNRKDGSVMVYVPAGEFEMGDGKFDNCPKHRVFVSAYWIGVYAVTNGQYLQFMQATKHRAPDNQVHREAGKVVHPVTDISWDDAVAYAKWAGGALPTEAQWEKAARGPAGLIYPWGNDWDASRCRHDKNKGSERTCPVTGYPGGVSGYGSYNQSGNVWEWCADWYGNDYYGKSPARDPRGPEGGSYRVYRGGCWWSGVPEGLRGAYRCWGEPGIRYDDRGLRLVRPASPSLPS
jgi:formylglycine-generating enzyme